MDLLLHQDESSFEMWTVSSSSSSSPSQDTLMSAAPDPSKAVVPLRRKPIPRKGHTKSRRGCFACKRRKVKCQENLPECLNCTRIGLTCEYPKPQKPSASVSPPTLPLSLSPPSPVQSIEPSFAMEDMRFFHHFLFHAYPPVPMLQGDDIWKGVATLSYSYDFLIHAMLGLAASHLGLYGHDYASQALSHRVKSIQCLNQALSRPCASSGEADARFATIMTLAFQAACMPEGMLEWVTMMRGCKVIAITSMLTTDEHALFGPFTREGYSDSVRKLVASGPPLQDPTTKLVLKEFLVSLRDVAPLCSSKIEIQLLAAIDRVMRMAMVSSRNAFAEIIEQYQLINNVSNEEFAHFIAPDNYAAQLLLIHFVFAEFFIGGLALNEAQGERFGFRKRAMCAWLDTLVQKLPADYHKHLEWCLKYGARLHPHRKITHNIRLSILPVDMPFEENKYP
ncbi:hypothetical protein B0H63DRAFT_200157 [Podospora didyma]|uniref:Zn(2)-C6 fungal-type domain-containing protein n=1 Tax=Podospora didyma TaxID=330526 RepID=A0AAE0NGY2_9PEZI|nr:hypothetical protein B0H63DRAFT_200157 [Podospora didyma]